MYSSIRRVVAGIVIASALSISVAKGQEDVRRWRMNSLLHPKLFGEAGERFAETVRRLSDDRFIIEVHDRLVLDQDTFDALKNGMIDAAWGSAGHHHREDPALTIFTGFPFGPDTTGFTAWMQVGGGAAALEAVYARHGLKSLYCGILPAEGGGWFREPISDIGDLDDLRMRSFGYAARVLQRLGVVPYELPAQEVKPALEAGLIDAAEFSLPSIDADLGIADVAKHLYFPGWQQPVTSLELLMLERRWDELPDQERQILSAACDATLSITASIAAAGQVEALARFRDMGIVFHNWPNDVLVELRKAWDAVIAEDVSVDPLLADAWNGYLRFRDEYGAWHSLTHVDWMGSARHPGEPETIED